MTDLAGACQLAIYAALTAIDGLPPVVSEVPMNEQDQAVFPFILLGDDNVTQIGSKTHRVERHEVSIHVCMQSTSKLIVRGYQEQVRAALHDQPIAADGASLSNPVALNQNTPLLDDGATYVGSSIFAIIAQDA
ncbi:DUF3168 domain-containing protein [Sphingomonas bacterium]|uniref:tail completion protein gp17 n=1 Tax=Sphingomonas bacterium TaxID=1895847 RepID=UPI001576C80A|nr:DUF3168 domain-containing protein [Sphingomonas bacterium]